MRRGYVQGSTHANTSGLWHNWAAYFDCLPLINRFYAIDASTPPALSRTVTPISPFKPCVASTLWWSITISVLPVSFALKRKAGFHWPDYSLGLHTIHWACIRSAFQNNGRIDTRRLASPLLHLGIQCRGRVQRSINRQFELRFFIQT